MSAALVSLLALSACVLGACGTPTGTVRRDAGSRDGGASPDAGASLDASTPSRDAALRPDAGDVCGDGMRGITEACDDGDATGGDGCSETCDVEDGFRCPPAGGACRPVVCGDRLVETPERCDDGNGSGGDGCSSDCQLEPGWVCAVPGLACQAERCGDALLAGFEQCDDGNLRAFDGCDPECRLEPGFDCPVPGAACVPTVCGDGRRQGTEQCDDGNTRAFDACDPDCRNEPDCAGGACVAVCGDGVILPGSAEGCDDGNTTSGDGCSSSCAVEPGFACSIEPLPLPDALSLPVVYRDLRGVTQSGSPTHPDFDARGGSGITYGMVGSALDGEGRPTFSGLVSGGSGALDAASFFDWYRDSGRNLAVLDRLALDRLAGTDSYRFDRTGFFPLDGRGWQAPGSPAPESYPEAHNYSFTTEAHYWFQFRGDERLEFRGDDDLWVFVDGWLCLDVGGLHPPESGIMDLGNPASAGDARQIAVVQACRDRLVVGRVYEVVVFHAERRCCGSNFQLTLSGFATQVSSCDWSCGDGIVTRFELCDDGPGMNTGEYGRCGVDCRSRGPYCGDGLVASGREACDAGPDNDGRYGGCNPDCTLGPRCGDGVRQGPEECDAGPLNGVDGTPCNADCRLTLL